MSASLPDSFVEVRFQVPTALLEAACQAIAPYVMSLPDGGPSESPRSAAKARFAGITQKEMDMLLRGDSPKRR